VSKNRRFYLLVIAILLFVWSGVFALVGVASLLHDRLDQAWSATPQRLVYHIDHQAVLDACRQVLKDPQAAGFPPMRNGATEIAGLQISETVPAALPAVLRELKFAQMLVTEGRAEIWFGGGFAHWGFVTGRERVGTSEWELIPGLIFFADQGGKYPRDPVKQPYFRNCKRYWLAAAIALAAGLGVTYRLRSARGQLKQLNDGA
jgi:hypothetical protein